MLRPAPIEHHAGQRVTHAHVAVALGAASYAKATATETVLHSFGDGSVANDGQNPYYGSLVKVGSALYGTTNRGGVNGIGSVFKITPSGTETVLYSFGSTPNDGANPYSGLTNVGGVLYGTTYGGGVIGDGTVFSITPSGTYTQLYSFAGGSDGAFPWAGLTNLNGILYGTTFLGGASNAGAAFSITTSGTESVVYSFTASPDGADPESGLTTRGGVLFGTTCNGGVHDSGTVFKLTIAGKETVLYNFGQGNGDGGCPRANNLVWIDGTFYGTTSSGGDQNGGTVFSITQPKHGQMYHQLHSFQGGSDGAEPTGSLINLNGTLYGTTQQGGTVAGVAYSITASGVETVLYNFCSIAGCADGYFPYGGLTNVGGVLYGTTHQGGNGGDGTVYTLSGF